MPYLNILTWDPDKRDAVIERVKKIGLEHEGIKVLGTWADVNGGRCYQLTEEPVDPKLSIKANFTWNDILKIETVPVMDAGELIKLMDNI
jgi:hypothetical protein